MSRAVSCATKDLNTEPMSDLRSVQFLTSPFIISKFASLFEAVHFVIGNKNVCFSFPLQEQGSFTASKTGLPVLTAASSKLQRNSGA